MYNKRVKVVGTVMGETKEGEKRPAYTKKVVVVEQQNLAALFRRDHELARLSIQIQDTTDELTPMTFSDFPVS